VKPALLEAAKLPLTMRLPPTLEEALEMKPPYRVAREFTNKVEEALRGPETLRGPPILEEAFEMRPFLKVERPKACKVPEVDRLPFPPAEESTKKTPLA